MSTFTIVLIIAAALAIYAVAIYNGLVGLKNRVANAWQQIDVQLKRRHDLIPNLVEVVKDSMEYEQETLTAVVEARNKAIAADNPAESGLAEGMLGAALGKLLAVVEAYPELKVQENIAGLMEELATTENQITFARQHYNDIVMRFNTKVETVPSNIVANLFGFRQKEYFEVPETEKAAIKVDLK